MVVSQVSAEIARRRGCPTARQADLKRLLDVVRHPDVDCGLSSEHVLALEWGPAMGAMPQDQAARPVCHLHALGQGQAAAVETHAAQETAQEWEHWTPPEDARAARVVVAAVAQAAAAAIAAGW